MKLSTMTVLSDAEIQQIHAATLDVLEKTGVQVDHAEMRRLLAEKGANVDESTQRVRLSRACVEKALATIPQQFEVCNRRGQKAFTLGDGVPKIAAGHNAVFWLDSQTGETRPSRIDDVERFSRVCQALPTIDMIGIPVMPQDGAVAEASLLYGVRATIANSDKPIYFSTDSAKVNRAIIDMLSAAYEGDFGKDVYGITQLSPTSPLFWENGVCEAILDTLTTNVPISILPEPNAGISAPYTLAGLLTVNNIECVSGLVMIQMLRPGAKVMYANSWTTTDMRNGFALVGSTETTLCRIAAAQLAKFYKVPSHTTAPNSDNHAHDEQNSWEKTFSLFSSVASGHDLIVNCGMFATGMTCSHEQLVMDEEIAAMSRRIAAGIAVNDETVAGAVINEVGPRGDYMTTDHTMTYLRSDEYLMPRVSVRGPFAAWQNVGGKDTTALARDRAEALMATTSGAIDATRLKTIDAIVKRFESA